MARNGKRDIAHARCRVLAILNDEATLQGGESKGP